MQAVDDVEAEQHRYLQPRRLDGDVLKPIDLLRIRDEQKGSHAGGRQRLKGRLVRRRDRLHVEILRKLSSLLRWCHLRDQGVGASPDGALVGRA